MTKDWFIDRLERESPGHEWFEANGSIFFLDNAPKWVYEIDVNTTGILFRDHFVRKGRHATTRTVTQFGPFHT